MTKDADAESGNISEDTLEMLTEEMLGAGDSIMFEQSSNGASQASVLGHVAVAKFAKVNALESAAAEMILQRNV